MKGKFFHLLSVVSVIAITAAFNVVARAQDIPSGFPTPPSAEQIQALQQQAMQQAQTQVQQDSGSSSMPPGTNFGPPPGAEEMQKRGEEAAKRGMAQGAAGQLKGLQQGARGMEQGLKQFEALVKKAEKAGGGVGAEIKEKYNQLKANIQKIKNAKSADEISEIDTDSLQSDINEVMESAGSAIQNAQQLQGLKQGIRGMENGLKQFEAQLGRITKQKVAIPTEIKDKVAAIKTKIAAVKAAKNWEEAEAAGVEELQEQMESLNDYREQLEVLIRLPQMQKQLDLQYNNLAKDLKKSQAIVTKLAKNGIDLKEEYDAYTAAVNNLKAVRDEALAAIKSGNSEEIKTALDNLEENFFGQLQDTWEYSRIIQTMSGLGRFQSELKKGLSDAQKRLTQLKKKKVNTEELEAIYNQAKQQGDAVQALIKARPMDEDAVQEGLSQLEDLKTQFTEKADELSGTAMPWEGGTDQFKDVSGYDISKYLKK